MDRQDVSGNGGERVAPRQAQGNLARPMEERLEHWRKVGEANARGYGVKDEAAGTVEQQLEIWRSRGAASAKKYGIKGRSQKAAV